MNTMNPRKKASTDSDAGSVTRITVSVPTPDYEHLLRVAESKRVSMSWVVRDAVEQYLSADMPLFAQVEKTST